MIKVILADDYPAIISGARKYIDRLPNFRVTATANSMHELWLRLQDTPCQMLITEFSLPIHCIGSAHILFKRLKQDYPTMDLIILTTIDIPAVLYQISRCGVKGVIHKSDDIEELGHALSVGTRNQPYLSKSIMRLIRTVPHGRVPTKREAEVLKLYIVGNSLQEIADHLKKSVKTVGLQKAAAMRKMGLRNDIELGRYYCAMTSMD